MPYHCCVPNCNGNYPSGPKVAIFGFPKDPELRQKWVQGIKRKNFIPKTASKVCELHFQKEYIERKTTFKNKATGEVLEAPLKVPRLAAGAVPSEFPSYFSDESSDLSRPNTPIRISSPEARHLSIECGNVESALAERLDSVNEGFNVMEKLEGFETINEAFNKMDKLKEGWVKVQGAKNVCFFYLNESPEERQNINKLSVYLSEDLSVKVFYGELEINKIVCADVQLYNFPMQISETTMLYNVLSDTKKFLIDGLGQESTEHENNKLNLVSDILSTVSDQRPEIKDNVKFLQEQIKLLATRSENQLQYSYETALLACLLYSVSPHAYTFLRSLGRIILPFPDTIKTICASFNTEPQTEQNEAGFLKYISNKFNLVDDNDKTVILILEEIDLTCYIDYKGGNKHIDSAKKAHVYMVNSLRSDYKDVVHVLPVHTISGKELHKITRKVIMGLEEIGFEVLVVVTDNRADNNELNKKAMSYFADQPHVSNEYPHPCDSNRPLFYIIDPVLILKNIRKNWIYKKGDKLLKFPDLDSNHTKIRMASFEALRDMYIGEKKQLPKYGCTLTINAFYPSSMDRQNIELELQIFNHNTVAALQQLGPKLSLPHFEDTAIFIHIICRWWVIINAKSPLAVTANPNYINTFLQSFLAWLEKWKGLIKGSAPSGGLSKETHVALYQSTSGLLKLTEYCINKKNYNYVLLGQVQTDKLEDRFGKYVYNKPRRKMTSTNVFNGLAGDKNSSRVLRPPGGGHTDIFRAPEPPVKKNMGRNASSIIEGVSNGAEAVSPVKSTPNPPPPPKNDPPAESAPSNRNRVPPGGFSSGPLW